jgi:hypothetical protein
MGASLFISFKNGDKMIEDIILHDEVEKRYKQAIRPKWHEYVSKFIAFWKKILGV